jgi:hypothetical protein
MYGVDYQKAKELTFKQLYGGVFEQYKDLDFLNLQVSIYVRTGKLMKPRESLYALFLTTNSKDELENMNPQKLFNYVLQNMETSVNIKILYRILKLLKNKQTKLVLYTYDSFLFDFANGEEDVMEQIQSVFERIKVIYKN